MTFQIVYSRKFLEKVLSWRQALKDMAFQATEHAAQDPDLPEYRRPYLTPFRQKHPTTDHQYTLYFKPISANEIFVVWINDTSCLHETRANYPDPCRKEFERLLAKGDLETYDPAVHHVRFDVQPDPARPFRCRSTYLNQKTTLNTFVIGASAFVGHAFYCGEPDPAIADIHVREFLRLLHEHLTMHGANLQFQFTKVGHDVEIDRLTRTHDPRQWHVVDDLEDFILRKI
jgi:hypothetical protein